MHLPLWAQQPWQVYPPGFTVPFDPSLQVFRIKAIKLGEKLLPAFDTPTGIPKGVVNFKR